MRRLIRKVLQKRADSENDLDEAYHYAMAPSMVSNSCEFCLQAKFQEYQITHSNIYARKLHKLPLERHNRDLT